MRIIKFVLPLVLLALTNCGTRSTLGEPVEQPKPLASNPVLCAYSNEEPALQGAIPKPQNEEEAEGIRRFLGYVAGLIDFGREADRVAKIAKQECLDRVGGEPGHTDTNTEQTMQDYLSELYGGNFTPGAPVSHYGRVRYPVNPVQVPNPQPTPTAPVAPAGNPARDQALAMARLGISQELQRRGLSSDAYAPQFQSYLDQILGAVPQDAEDYSQYFSPNLASDVLTGIQAGQRNQYKGQVNERFGGNFASQYLPDTLLDDTINQTLNTQYGDARSVLERGLARGQYNDRGFNSGLGALDNARKANEARLNTIEGDLLSGYRAKLGDVRNNAFNSATGYQLGDTFNLDDFASRADSIASQARQNAPGEFLSAVGTTPLFDLGSIGGAAGIGQGSVNLNNLDVREGLDRRKLAAARGRGLGSQGAF